MAEQETKVEKKEESKPKKIKFGRPTKYRPEMCQELIDFFNRDHTEINEDVEEEMVVDEKGKEESTKKKRKVSKKRIGARLPTLERFCAERMITKQTLLTWTKDYPDFLDAYLAAKALQADQLVQNGARGFYNAGFSKLLLTNLTDYKDESHQSVKSEVTSVVKVDYDKLTDEELDALETAKKAMLRATKKEEDA